MEMKTQRKIDELGRVVLPIEMRRERSLNERDAVNISCDRGKIIMERAAD